jgi:hypothetical protein
VRQPARGVLELLVSAGRRTVGIPGLDPATGGTVTVVALSPSFAHGALAQVRFKAVPKPAHARKPKKHGRKRR